MKVACDEKQIGTLKQKALEIKKGIIELAVHAQEGHCASALSIADLVTALFFRRLRIDPNNPEWEDRDRFVLSKGHACQALYVALHHRGFFDKEKLLTFLQKDTGLAGHPVRGGAPGVEVSTGSLGQGYSVSIGLALGAKLRKKDFQTFAIIGDGESNEGIVWEGALAAAQYQLDNLTVILDRNNYQCDGYSNNVMKLDPIEDKWTGFGWAVRTCDGHNMEQIVDMLDDVPFEKGKPSLLLAYTTKGKGVDFMESSAAWHYRAPTQDQFDEAVAQLERGCYL